VYDARRSWSLLRMVWPDSTLPHSTAGFRTTVGRKLSKLGTDMCLRAGDPRHYYTAVRAASPFLDGSAEFAFAF